MEQLLDAVSWTLMLGGSFLSLSGVVGLLRFPDYFARMHAASITDTLSTMLILIGLALQVDPGLITVKLLLILLFVWFTSPVASHALAKAALHDGIKPRFMIDTESDSK